MTNHDAVRELSTVIIGLHNILVPSSQHFYMYCRGQTVLSHAEKKAWSHVGFIFKKCDSRFYSRFFTLPSRFLEAWLEAWKKAWKRAWSHVWFFKKRDSRFFSRFFTLLIPLPSRFLEVWLEAWKSVKKSVKKSVITRDFLKSVIHASFHGFSRF